MKPFVSLFLLATTVLSPLMLSSLALANPYPDPSAVPADAEFGIFPDQESWTESARPASTFGGHPVLRVQVDWSQGSAGEEEYRVAEVTRENSGTPGILASREKKPKWGSYLGALRCGDGKIFYDSIGTGSLYRQLTRALTFRFPAPESAGTECEFSLTAENPQTGVMEKVLTEALRADDARPLTLTEVELVSILPARSEQKLFVTIYAEGYTRDRREKFLNKAKETVAILEKTGFPGFDHFEFTAAFAESKERLGSATDLGLPILERDSFLGLYFPYWTKFGRWHHVVYPTREKRYRDGLGQVPYDYPLILVDDGSYWGVGNYKELTAVPARSFSFTYLLLHEFGHFFGLNEEYDGGGPTELQFAPQIHEPWSQNLTFNPVKKTLKWKDLLHPEAPVPTPASFWRRHYSSKAFPIGAYAGGYADSEPENRSYIPTDSGACIMESGKRFCDVCQRGILDVVEFDLGHAKSGGLHVNSRAWHGHGQSHSH